MHRAEADAARASGATDPDEAASASYRAAFLTCPATLALDRAQAAMDATDESRRKRGLHPERARHWLTYTDAEGLPAFDDD